MDGFPYAVRQGFCLMLFLSGIVWSIHEKSRKNIFSSFVFSHWKHIETPCTVTLNVWRYPALPCSRYKPSLVSPLSAISTAHFWVAWKMQINALTKYSSRGWGKYFSNRREILASHALDTNMRRAPLATQQLRGCVELKGRRFWACFQLWQKVTLMSGYRSISNFSFSSARCFSWVWTSQISRLF